MPATMTSEAFRARAPLDASAPGRAARPVPGFARTDTPPQFGALRVEPDGKDASRSELPTDPGLEDDAEMQTDEFVPEVDVEEWRSRAFAPSTPAAPDSVTVAIRPHLEFAAVPARSDPIVRLLVDVTAQGPSCIDPGAGPAAHVILLLDLSASMNHPDKYPVLTQALRSLLHDLAAPGRAEVLLSVVVFGHGAKTLFRDVPASTLDPRDVLARIDASPWRFGRYTDVAGALKRAGRISLEQLHTQRAMPIRVYLLTDGRPQDLPRTRRIMARIAKLPVDVDGLAFGEDADVPLLLDLLSGCRGGTVKHVRADTLVDAFDRIAATARRIVSNRALVDVELAPGVVGGAAYRFRPARSRFPGDAFAGGTRFHTDLGTLESGRTYSLFFELRLPESVPGRAGLARVTVRLRGTAAARVFEAPVWIERTAASEPGEPDAAVVAAGEVLAAMTGADTATQISALRVRRRLYDAERRDPHVIAIIDKAISSLEEDGSLETLSPSEQATLQSHTCTAGGPGSPRQRTEFAG